MFGIAARDMKASDETTFPYINNGALDITSVVHFSEKFEDVEANGSAMNKEFVNQDMFFYGDFSTAWTSESSAYT